MRNCDAAKELCMQDIAVGLHALYQQQSGYKFEKEIHGYESLYLQDGLYLIRGLCGEFHLEKGSNPREVCEKLYQRCIEIENAGAFVSEEVD